MSSARATNELSRILPKAPGLSEMREVIIPHSFLKVLLKQILASVINYHFQMFPCESSFPWTTQRCTFFCSCERYFNWIFHSSSEYIENSLATLSFFSHIRTKFYVRSGCTSNHKIKTKSSHLSCTELTYFGLICLDIKKS